MEEECKITLNTGLRGVTIASTRICEVDGKNGRLVYRGYKIEDLARASYEEVVHLLLHERLPSPAELTVFRKLLAAERTVPDGVLAALKTMPPTSHPMDVLQAAVPMLANHDPDLREESREASLRIAVRADRQVPHGGGRLAPHPQRPGAAGPVPRARPRRQLHLPADRQGARGRGRAGHRHRARAARRALLQRLHLRRARGGLDAGSHVRRGRGRGRARCPARSTAAPTPRSCRCCCRSGAPTRRWNS